MGSFANKIQNSSHGRTYLFSVGQAGFIIKSASGQLLAIDLYLSDCVERIEGHMGYKRLLPKLLYPGELEFRGVVATHFHRDHFDMDSIPEMLSSHVTELFCPKDCEETIHRLEMQEDHVHYIAPGNSCQCGDFTLHFLHCDHGAGAPEAVGVLVCVDGIQILETGDTCLHREWASHYLSQGELDVLIAPINGAYGNLNEQECALLAQTLHPKLTVPCHYGMFASHGGNPGLFYEIMNEKNMPVYLMTQGERLTLK